MLQNITLQPPNRHAALKGKTILQIIPRLDAGGAERTTIDIAAALNEVGGRALVACEGGRMVSELQMKGGLWLPFPAACKNPFAMTFHVLTLARLLRAENVALIHARSRAPAWVALGAARLAGVPFVTTYHGSYGGTSKVKLLYNSVMARGDAVIANSKFTASTIAKLFPFAREKLSVIYRGSDFQAFSSARIAPERIAKLRQSWNIADQRLVLCAARLTSWKGQMVLIEAVKRLKDQGLSDTIFILAGDAQGRDGYVAALDAAIKRYGLQDIVLRVGHCTDMPAAMVAASAIVVPSTEPEAFGRVAVEAQAVGTPVIVSDLGAASETVLAPPLTPAQNRTGWLVPAGKPDVLAEALKEVLALGASARDELAKRARAHVETHFSLEHMCDKTLNLYEALLAHFGG